MGTCNIDLPTKIVVVTILMQSLISILITDVTKRESALLTCVFTLGELFDRLDKGEFQLINC